MVCPLVTGEGKPYIIIDNYLSSQDHQFVWNYVQSENFQSVHHKKWTKAFRLSDGDPLWGPPYLSDSYHGDKTNDVYPTGKAVDLIIEKLKITITNYTNLLGEQGKDWAYFFARAYLYPQGAGLSWHRDNENFVKGAFVYYAHPNWNPQWGGELMIASADTSQLKFPKSKMHNGQEISLGSHLNNNFETQALMDSGIGHFILAKPNRLVLMGTGTLHAIKRVDPNAGDNVRATIQGFFQDPLKNG